MLWCVSADTWEMEDFTWSQLWSLTRRFLPTGIVKPNGSLSSAVFLSNQKFTGGHNRLSRQQRRDKIARVPLSWGGVCIWSDAALFYQDVALNRSQVDLINKILISSLSSCTTEKEIRCWEMRSLLLHLITFKWRFYLLWRFCLKVKMRFNRFNRFQRGVIQLELVYYFGVFFRTSLVKVAGKCWDSNGNKNGPKADWGLCFLTDTTRTVKCSPGSTTTMTPCGLWGWKLSTRLDWPRSGAWSWARWAGRAAPKSWR